MEDEVRMLESWRNARQLFAPAGSWREETAPELGTVELHV